MEHPPFGPTLVRGVHELPSITPAHALPALRGVAHEANIDLQVMDVGPHPEVRSAPDGIAEGRKQAGKHRHQVSLRVWFDGLDDISSQTA